MVAQAIATARTAGATANILVRGDSAYGNRAVVRACRRGNAEFSLVMTKNPAIARAIAAIPDTAWTPVRYPGAVRDPDTGAWISDAEVAEVTYTAFAASQLKEREMAGLPPFAHLALLRAEARTAEAAKDFLQAAADLAAQIPGASELLIYPAVPTSVARVANIERMQMLIEASTRGALQRVLTPWMASLPSLRSQHKAVMRWALDVDPLAI
jgi:hypothetical protein